MLTVHSRLKPHPDVVFTELEDDEAVLLHLGTQTYFSLNRTGVCIWRAMGRGLELGQIASEIESLFEVDVETARDSVLELASQLASENLVEPVGEPGERG
ncbi:MAG: PqqD family protein [bacterium]|nr:PqqD family protein [bacterium]